MPETPPRDANVTPTCPICAAPLPAGRPRTWCSPSCRQAAYRRRHALQPAPPQPVPPAPRHREHTVHQCSECEQRYLGEQWCPDCARPCRRLGPGGSCPSCDEPVTVTDLQEVPMPYRAG